MDNPPLLLAIVLNSGIGLPTHADANHVRRAVASPTDYSVLKPGRRRAGGETA